MTVVIRGSVTDAAYLRGGLLPRPPPDGLPVLLGPFSSWNNMFFLHGPGNVGTSDAGPETNPGAAR